MGTWSDEERRREHDREVAFNLGAQSRDAEIARLKAEVERLAYELAIVRRNLDCARDDHDADLAAHKRALAAGPAALRARYCGFEAGIVKGAYEAAAVDVERAQADEGRAGRGDGGVAEDDRARWKVSPWQRRHRFDVDARRVADRHYNRQKVGSPQFVPPGRCLVLYAPRLLWVTSWPFAEYVKHRWPGAWVCSVFRREVRRGHQASTLIRYAVAHTRYYLGEPPTQGMVTFVNPAKVKPKATPGACFIHAGFESDGETKGGLLAFVLRAEKMPPP